MCDLHYAVPAVLCGDLMSFSAGSSSQQKVALLSKTMSQNSSVGCVFGCHASLIWPFYTKIQKPPPNKVVPSFLLKGKDFFTHSPKLRCHLSYSLEFCPCGSARPLP